VILVDTSVLSLAFRRRIRIHPESPLVQTLRRLIEQDQPVAVPGIVLQELLSGVSVETEFERLKNLMEGFPVVPATSEHHLEAARIANTCRRAGISVSTVDCLIAAMAIATKSQLLTDDRDFVQIASRFDLHLGKSQQIMRQIESANDSGNDTPS
jgi:predicted nucleic acid-binding protein